MSGFGEQSRRCSRRITIVASLALTTLLVACASEEESPSGSTVESETEAQGGEDGSDEGSEGSESAAASEFPTERLELMVSAGAGGSSDASARTIAASLEDVVGDAVVVENVTGGGGAVAIASLMGEEPDGHTIGHFTRSQVMLFAGGVVEGYEYDDLTYVARLQDDPYLIAVPADSPFETLDDLAEAAQDQNISIAGFVPGGPHHITAELFADQAGIDIAWTPFESGGEAVLAALGGHTDAVFENPGTVLEHVSSGDMRVLGVTSEQSLRTLPDVPTFSEQGYDIVASHWRGIVAHGDVPDDIVDQLADLLEEAYNSEEYQSLLEAQNVEPGWMGPEEFQTFVEQDYIDAGNILSELDLEE